MRLLLFCNPSNIHNYNYIKNVLVRCNYDITIYSYSLPIHGIKQEYIDFYERNRVKIIGGHSISEQGHFKYIIKSFFSIGKITGEFDCAHVQYVSPYIAPIIYFYRKRYKKIVLTYWGSDLLRSNFVFRIMCRPLIRISSWITFITSDMQSTFNKYFHIHNNQKTELLDFGNMFFDSIDEMKLINGNEHDTLCLKYHLNPQKTIITIGYYWRKQMQQRETLETLINSGLFSKEKVQFAIPAYSITHEEKIAIEEYCSKNGYEVSVYDYFMNEEEVSGFRAITDIFINAQTTDAFSSAMTEHLYSGSLVINGSWLKYSVLDEKGVYYLTFDSFESLPYIVCEAIGNMQLVKEKSMKNRDIISSFCSWRFWKEKWLQLYN